MQRNYAGSRRFIINKNRERCVPSPLLITLYISAGELWKRKPETFKTVPASSVKFRGQKTLDNHLQFRYIARSVFRGALGSTHNAFIDLMIPPGFFLPDPFVNRFPFASCWILLGLF